MPDLQQLLSESNSTGTSHPRSIPHRGPNEQGAGRGPRSRGPHQIHPARIEPGKAKGFFTRRSSVLQRTGKSFSKMPAEMMLICIWKWSRYWHIESKPPDGRWIYLNLHAGDNFHIWRQRFPEGQPEQITSGPTEDEGIALAPDGRSLATSVGLRQRTVSVPNPSGDRQISIEGYAYKPTISPDGKKLYYRVLKGGTSPFLGASELRVADIESGRNELLLPGFAVTSYSVTRQQAGRFRRAMN